MCFLVIRYPDNDLRQMKKKLCFNIYMFYVKVICKDYCILPFSKYKYDENDYHKLDWLTCTSCNQSPLDW